MRADLDVSPCWRPRVRRRHSASKQRSSSSSSSRAACWNHAFCRHGANMEPVWTCRTPEEASQEGRSHVHTSTAPTSANEQHCRRWIGTPNCATFAAHKAGRLQALVDQSSSRIGRQEDRMHQATVSEIAVSCLAPRASATNDIAIARKGGRCSVL